MRKKYVVALKVEEREQLLAMLGSGSAKTRTLTHARILLKANEDWCNHDIFKALNVSVTTVERVQKQFVFEGFEASLKRRRSRRVYRRKVDGEQEARMAALACSSLPEGYARWSLRLLADRELEKIDQYLENEQLYQWIKADLSKRYPKTKETGRNSTPVEVVLRMLVVKRLYAYSYEDTVERVSDSLNLRRFCRVYLNDVRVDTTLLRWANLIQPKTLEKFNQRIVR